MAGRVSRTSGEATEARIGGEAMCDTLEQVVGIRAIVVREGDDVRAEPRQAGVPGAGEPPFRVDVLDLERRVAADELREPLVVVLVDQHDPERGMRLSGCWLRNK